MAACCSKWLYDGDIRFRKFNAPPSDCQTFLSGLHSKLNSFRKDGRYIDVAVKVETQIFKCHRLVLASMSQYFDNVFRSAVPGTFIEIVLENDINATDFEAVLHYAYSGNLPELIRNSLYKYITQCNFRGFCSSLHFKLNRFYVEGRYADVTVEVEKQNFKCHKLVLASISQYFDDIFRGAVHKIPEKIVLDNDDVHWGEFEAMLDYAYHGHPPHLTSDNVCRFLSISEFLKSHAVEVYCLEFIHNELSRFSVACTIRILEYALSKKRWSLMKDLVAYILSRQSYFFGDGGLHKIPTQIFHFLMKEYQSYFLSTGITKQAVAEACVEGMIHWTLSCGKEASCFEQISDFINFELISTERFISFLSEKFKIQCEDKLSLKQDILKFLMAKFHNNNNNTPMANGLDNNNTLIANGHNNNNTLLHCVGIPNSGAKLTEMHALVKYEYEGELSSSNPMRVFTLVNERNSEWFFSNTALYSLDTLQTVTNADNCFFCYGISEDCDQYFYIFSSITAFCMKQSLELTCPPCTSEYFDMCGQYNGARLYWYNNDVHNFRNYEESTLGQKKFMGNKDEIYRGIYQYNCSIDRWYPLPEPMKKVSSACLTADDNLLYMIGGFTIDQKIHRLELGLVQAYDQRCSKWMQLSKTFHNYTDGSCCTLNKQVYVSDGSIIESYNPISGKWREVCFIWRDIDYSPCVKRPKIMLEEPEKQLLPYNDLLWMYTYDGYETVLHKIEPHEETVETYYSLNDAIYKWYQHCDFDKLSCNDLLKFEMLCDQPEYESCIMKNLVVAPICDGC